LQVSPQIDPTSPTQIESHAVLQQYGSWAQIDVAHGSQLDFSCVPLEQMPWVQPAPPPDELPLDPPEDDEPLEEPPPPPHVSPQIVPTSLTHCASHLTLQQYESCAQISDEHGSHVVVSFLPVEQRPWAHVPPPLDEPDDEPDDEPLLLPLDEPLLEPLLEPDDEPLLEPLLLPLDEPLLEPLLEPDDDPLLDPLLLDEPPPVVQSATFGVPRPVGPS